MSLEPLDRLRELIDTGVGEPPPPTALLASSSRLKARSLLLVLVLVLALGGSVTGLVLAAAPRKPLSVGASTREWHVRSLRASEYRFDRSALVVASRNTIFVSNLDSITELNAANGSVLRVLWGSTDHFGHPRGMAVAGSELFISSGGNDLTEVSIGGSYQRQFKLPVRLDGASLVYDGRHLWFANPSQNTVGEIDPRSGRVLRLVASPHYGLNGPSAMAVAGGNLWVVNGGGSSLTEISLSSGRLVRVVKARSIGPSGRYDLNAPISIAFDGRDLWVVNYYEGDSVSEFSAATGAPVRVIPARALGVRIPYAVAANDRAVWVVADAPAGTPASVVEIQPRTGQKERLFSGRGSDFEKLGDVALGENGQVFVVSDAAHASVTEIYRAN